MDADDLSIDTIAVQLTRLQRIRDRTALQIRTEDRVDPAVFAVLFRLLCDGPMRSGALAEAVYSDASTVSRQVAQLVERELVRRTADPADGRATVLEVTERGREVAERIRRRRHDNLTRVMADWTPDNRALFADLLRQFVDDFERARPMMVAGPRLTNPDEAERNS
ncbi:DNA-binding transcriptional regulator, MarR family [Nocardia amikacinitolerans]|uniref:DNA-binding transcriptional regulator, MarR family n=1 Tax=Nocardia amikacinitolerans TaxID=756689 RepID=A0A285LVH1_9NOCA|nr:MarR family transcriptional regulator [Nocardia amikacinitolerans]MCP2278246.1 DNA-binding transcriptional regulator, MarR family [Nocardia amikacinitolerans]MCP2299188.1 DNA-binding transcriptional regulator, MarR family [Nocardia amikacinitolerans]SNY88912.1 DNA-binding transcriptional regulator, MarR family [Nocardia amikacinitolerans]